MENTQNRKKSNLEEMPFMISKLSTLQYIKLIFIGANNELIEIRTEVSMINNDIIQLFYISKENINITCPIGVALKFVTRDAIYFAKAILNDIKKVSDKSILVLNAPRKIVRQQNRKFYRIDIERPCVLTVNNGGKDNHQTYITQTVNISKGGALLSNVESILNDEPVSLQLSKDECCHMVLFLEQNLKIKLSAKFIRSESVNGSNRFAFQFIEILKNYNMPFDKYLTNEEIKLLKLIKSK